MITTEEIEQRKGRIDELFAAGDLAGLFQEANRLYEATDKRYAYFLGACYLNSWGVAQNNGYAAILLSTAAQYGDTYDYACYLAGIAYYRQRKYREAYQWFAKAEEAGVKDCLPLFADSAAGCALDLWNEVRHKYLQSEVTQGAAWVKNYMAVAIDKYMRAGEEMPDSMNAALYCGFARMMILMYNMGTTGMLDMQVVGFDSLSGIVAGGLEAMQKMLDTEAHDKTLAKCVIGAYFLDNHGQPLLAEYLRAFLALMESARDRSAAAFYRARWHMKRIGELRTQVQDAQLVVDSFPDIDNHYRTAEHKYGATVKNMMAAGQLPNLTKSYVPGNVPAVESCENFMTMFYSVYSAAQHPGAQQPAAQNPVDKVGGFLKNLFKF